MKLNCLAHIDKAIAVFATILAMQTTALAQTCNGNLAPSTPTSGFTVHGDGTVTHATTGLMWKVCSEGQTWSSTGGVPSCSGSTTTQSFDAALISADALEFAGYSDWRLPSIEELQSILESCRAAAPISNAINNEVFPSTPSTFFRAGSQAAGINAWQVAFTNGFPTGTNRNIPLSFRLVRGQQSLNGLGFLSNAYCGASANAAQATAPTQQLCGDASAPEVTPTASGFSWRCEAVRGGNNESGATVRCSTLRRYTVTVSSIPGESSGAIECVPSIGGVLGTTVGVGHNQTAVCIASPRVGFQTTSIAGCGGVATGAGVNRFVSGAATADCAITATFAAVSTTAINGVCGSAQNAFSATAPNANLCASLGGNSAVAQAGINWSWTCNGTNGGSNTTCSAPATTCTMDIDGDGVVNSTIDALIHARIAIGMNGPEVLNGLSIPLNASRRTWQAIRDHLVNRCGVSLPTFP